MRFFSLCITVASCVFASLVHAKDLVVFTPSSLTDVMAEVARGYENIHGQRILLSVAATSALARQVEAGAEADVFISADQAWMDWLKQKQLLDEKTIAPIASNRLVVAVRNEVENWASAKELLTNERFAMAEPNSVPAGRYAREALTHMGWWAKAQGKAVYGENVRVALKRVARGEVAGAIVYRSDVDADKTVRTLFEFPATSHAQIVYFAGAVKASRDASATQEFLGFLSGAEARTSFESHGFLPPAVEKP